MHLAASPQSQCSPGSSLSISSLSAACSAFSATTLTVSLPGLWRSLTWICSLSLPASSVTVTSPPLGTSLAASCSAVRFPSICSASPTWSTSLPVSDLPCIVICGLPPLSALVLRSPRGGSCRRVHDLFRPPIHGIFLQCALLPSAHSQRFAWLGQSIPAETAALSAHRTSSPSCLTLLWRPSSGELPRHSHRLQRALLRTLRSISLSVPDNMPRPPPIFPLCWAHTNGPPAFEPLNDRRMESVSHSLHLPKVPLLIGFFNGFVVLDGSSTSMQDIPALPAVSCSQCSTSAAIVFDRPTGRIARFCLSCQLLVPHDGDSPPPQTPVPPTPAPPPDNDPPSDWFSHGPLTRFASLFG